VARAISRKLEACLESPTTLADLSYRCETSHRERPLPWRDRHLGGRRFVATASAQHTPQRLTDGDSEGWREIWLR